MRSHALIDWLNSACNILFNESRDGDGWPNVNCRGQIRPDGTSNGSGVENGAVDMANGTTICSGGLAVTCRRNFSLKSAQLKKKYNIPLIMQPFQRCFNHCEIIVNQNILYTLLLNFIKSMLYNN